MAYAKKQSKDNNYEGFVYLRKHERYEVGAKYPFLRGFINISPDILEQLQAQEPDKFGNYKLEVAVWKGDDPEVLKGNAQLPYRKEEEAPARKPQAKKPAPKRQQDDDDDTF